jgi:surface antigen
MKKAALLLTAALALGTSGTAAFAQQQDDDAWYMDRRDYNADNYYSASDHSGFYDRSGRYQRFGYDRDDRDSYGPPPPPPPQGGTYYREGTYEQQCRSGGSAAGTIFGAAGGGLIGGAASHGNPAAIVGGLFLGGLLGNALSRDVDCDDQRVAFDSYYRGLDGRIGVRYDWRRGRNYGYFTPTREYTRRGYVCRDFTTVTYRGGREYHRDGTACRRDGYWYFD